MIFKVKNLGYIEEAEVDLSKDLIVFTGHNNTGKTYLAYAIYFLYTNEYYDELGELLENHPMLKDEQFEILADKYIKDKGFKINIFEFIESLSIHDNQGIINNVLKNSVSSLKWFFSTLDKSPFEKTTFNLDITDLEFLKETLEYKDISISGSSGDLGDNEDYLFEAIIKKDNKKIVVTQDNNNSPQSIVGRISFCRIK
jgi:AAA15 family ATPase/GTPase